MAQKHSQKQGRGGGEPSLRDQIKESGETEADPLKAAAREDRLDRKFFGREFLTWLIYQADDDGGGGHFKEEDGGPFRVHLGERVTLKALGEGAGEIAARGAAPAQSAEIRYAIAGGLTVREADLVLTRGDQVFQAAVSAELFDLRRVKLPALLSEDDVSRAEERLQLLDDLIAMLRAAYRDFLRARLKPTWESEDVPRLRLWLARSILEKKQLAVELEGEAQKGRRAERHVN
jgi:hypothetical protein